MFRLFGLIFSIAGATCAGIAVVIALVAGADSWQAILAAAGIGTALGMLASWVVARKLLQQSG